MEQILNKLSEIELTAKRIMEEADETKNALSAEMEQECKAFDVALEKETNDRIQELRNSLEKKKDSEISALRQETEKILSDLDDFYSKKMCIRDSSYTACDQLIILSAEIKYNNGFSLHAFPPEGHSEYLDFLLFLLYRRNTLFTIINIEKILLSQKKIFMQYDDI